MSDPSSNEVRNIFSYDTLLDTGAQMTMISTKVVNEVGLQPIGDVDVIPVSGDQIKTGRYMIRLDIPISHSVKLPSGEIGSERVMRGDSLDVGELPYNPADHDVLVGMDFIGLFHITMYGESFILSN